MKLSKISNLILLRIRKTEIHHGLKVAKNHSHRILKLKSSESHDYTIRSGKNLPTGSGPFLLILPQNIACHISFESIFCVDFKNISAMKIQLVF